MTDTTQSPLDPDVAPRDVPNGNSTNGSAGGSNGNSAHGAHGADGEAPVSSNGANGAAATERRTELADFLRSRRERITPEDVGLAPGARRRTPGLRREEVAQLAGVGVTWYTWLEQGRPINVSPQVLDAVARTLRLDPAEQAHLHRLADLSPVVECKGTIELPAEFQTILEGLDPIPAAVYNGRYDVLAWNRTYAALFPGLIATRPEERNVLWQLFTVPECCNQWVNRDEELPMMVATLRAQFGRHVGEPMWGDFVRRLSSASPEFAAMWAKHDVAGPRPYHKTYSHAAVGEVRLTATSLTPGIIPYVRLSVLTPEDEDTETKLAWLLAHPGTSSCRRHRY